MTTVINGSSPSITFSDSTTQSSGITATAGVVGVASGGTGLSSTPANGQLDIGNGTGFTRATITAGSGISVTNGAGSISIAATGGGTVTSVATGNGLSGGTITSTGTLVVACPTHNTVGSYAMGFATPSPSFSFGSNYAAGAGSQQMRVGFISQACFANTGDGGNVLSGTWKWMSGSTGSQCCGVICRVS
jgi:hypothetical protein